MSAEEANENDGHEASLIPINNPPPRTPLNAIPDPAQVTKAINTPRVSYGNTNNGRNAKSEPKSTSSTPCRGYFKAGSSSSKGVSTWTVTPECNNVEAQQFELQENSSFWRHHNVQVLIRIRPFNSLERIAQGYGSCLRQESNQTLVWLGHPETRFTFDHVACETVSQEKLFRVAGLPMVENCMSGYNSCVFAYGQTGSGKTYTMMGDIHDMEVMLSEDCGMTARIFEYLFMRIRAEEEDRKDERLKYSCKCSFLEIYNEQITDLLEPSSTNLQLREDLKKGVYVENLKEYSVMTVSDVIKLLVQGTSSRKMAATHMNSESSRSHSVFTCIIESQWENDSMTHFRYARLNLVDLAGSERQKTSGAEGDRLKEAANINKSLSTLGMVIMSLVDMAHGKQRHVPYRDSRLTFLLQDSLGGNSKTMIIANISPSICSANETLSTLKFAQRAKLIQNNAKVNEDASGDISALQRQIHMLKGQLSLLMNNQEPEKSFLCSGTMLQDSVFSDLPNLKDCAALRERAVIDYHDILSDQTKKMKCLEALLVASIRREKMGETTIQKLEAEIEHMNRLAHQRDEDAQRTKMVVRFREEKIKHLELLREGSFSSDAYLMEENSALLEEIKLLQAKIDRNPEVTRFALENIRLLEHLQMFQNFYEQGERETLMSEVSELRDQLLQTLELQLKSSPNLENQEGIFKERRCCKETNSKLMWEIDELRRELRKYVTTSQEALNSVPTSCNQAECIQPDYCSLVDSISVRSDPGDEVMLHNMTGSWPLCSISDFMMGVTLNTQPTETQKELEDARLIIQAMESERLCLFEKLQLLQEDNKRYVEILRNTEEMKNQLMLDCESLQLDTLRNQSKDLIRESGSDINGEVFKAKLDSMSKDLEKVMLLNSRFQEEHLLQLSQRQQVELVCEQVETEMTKTIFHLQEEVTSLQLELKERVVYMNQENIRLQDEIAGKDDKIRSLSLEWEKATSELTNFLSNGSKSLNEASSQIESIASLFSQVDVQICEQVERAVKVCIDKEYTILLLQKNLEEAQNMVHEMEQKFSSLKGATIALNQITHGSVEYSKEVMHLKMLLNEKTNMIESLESKLKHMDNKIIEAEKYCALPTVGEKPCLCDAAAREEDKDHVGFLELPISNGTIRTGFHSRSSNAELVSPDDITAQIELARLEVMESENAIKAFYADVEVFFTSLQADICRTSSFYSDLIQGLVEDIQATRKYMNAIKKSSMLTFSTSGSLPLVSRPPKLVDNQQVLLLQVRDGLTETNERLNILENSIKSTTSVFLTMMEEDRYSFNSSSGSELSTPSVASESDAGQLSPTCFSRSPSNKSQGELGLRYEGTSEVSLSPPKIGTMKVLTKDSSHQKITRLVLEDELEKAFCTFNKLYYHLAAFCNDIEVAACSYPEAREKLLPFLELREDEAGINCQSSADVCVQDLMDAPTHVCAVDVKIKPASFFLTKFEEARVTIQEADYMLNALLEANEKSKELSGMWKQAGEDLMVEKASLVEQVEQLKQSTWLKEQENVNLRDHFRNSLMEMENLVISLEASFLEMQKYVEDLFTDMRSDLLSVGRDILCCIFKSQSSLEGIFSEIMEKGFAFHVLYQCHIGEILMRSPQFVMKPSSLQFREQVSQPTCVISKDHANNATTTGGFNQSNKIDIASCLEEENWEQTSDNPVHENMSLRKELERKTGLLKGLLFDFSLLQESASNTKDIRDEYEKLILTLSEAQQDLESKTMSLDSLLAEHAKLEEQMINTETALFVSNSQLLYAKETVELSLAQNAELRMLKDDLYLKKSEAEGKLEEQMEIAKGLEKEVLRLASPTEAKITSSCTNIEHDLRRVIHERDRFSLEVNLLNDKLEMAYALADENEAIAIEARQESEASKVYAEQREEEVKILESSVEELECTINVLEKKVYEMDEELERHRLKRDSLESEIQALRQRILNVENIYPENVTFGPTENEISRKLPFALQEAHNQITMLEKERADQNKEIKELKDYVAELVLHADTQASIYLQKYKSLEAMVSELKIDSANSTSATAVLDKTEKVSARTRGSSSPFRCLTSLVQQMNLEKDQELSSVKLRVDELEALASSRKKEICVLRSRLAAAESMTHDVIRDLLSVKLDMTSYANLIDQHQVQRIFEQAQQQTEESVAKEREILNLKMQIRDLIEERESCISGFEERKGDFLAAQISIEKLKEREQLLSAQNDMMKRDKMKLIRKVAELEEIVEEVFPTRDGQQGIQQQTKMTQSCSQRPREAAADFSKRLAQSEQVLFGVNHEHGQYRRMSGSHFRYQGDRDPLGTKNRVHKS